MSQGIDVYTRYQTVTDWHAVRQVGYEFAYVKVSDGNENKPDNGWGAQGRSAGLAMGAYHYAQPGDPVAQANRLCDRAIQAGLTDLAPALDLESPFTPNQVAIDFAVAFVRQVKARGFRPCLYASDSMMRTVQAPVRAAVPETYMWVARYGAKPSVAYDVWQHSSTGRVPGISGSVDLDTGIIPRNTIPLVQPTPNTALLEGPLRLDPGQNRKISYPVAGRPPYLWLMNGYGAKLQVHQITPIRRTDDPDGQYGLNGWVEQPGQPWIWDADRPGPYFLGDDRIAMVEVRYSTDDPDWYIYVG